MSQILVRLKSPAGQSRVKVNLESPMSELSKLIKEKTNIDQDNQLLSFNQKNFFIADPNIKISYIKEMEDGVQVFVKPRVKEEVIREDDGVNPFIKKKTDDEEEPRKKCTHGPMGRCLNCVDKDAEPTKKGDGKDSKKEEKEKYITKEVKKCTHGPHGRCLNCITEETTDLKHLSFDLFVDNNFAKCKNHSEFQKCNNCLVDLEQSYKIKQDCKDHEPYPKGMCAKCIPPLVNVQRQAYRHVDYSSFMNYKEISGLIQYWLENINQRVGWVFGYYAEDPVYPKGVRAVVEAIYEPPQENDFNNSIIMDDPFEVHVSMLADALGLERIGWLFTTYNNDMFLSSQELLQAAKIQEDFKVRHPIGMDVSKQITIVLRCDNEKGSSVMPEVYMVSDQGQSLVRDKLVDEPDTRKHLKIKKQKNNQFNTKFFYQKKAVDKIDPDFFIVNVAHGQPKNTKFNILDNTNFPAANRPSTPQRPEDLKNFLNNRRHMKSYERFANFHVLLYLAKLFDIHTALSIAEHVKNKTEIPGYLEELIESTITYG